MCSAAVDTTSPTCLVPRNATSTATWQGQVASQYTCRSCTQSKDSRCSTAYLTSLFAGQSGIAAAYCNDAYLVIHANQSVGNQINNVRVRV